MNYKIILSAVALLGAVALGAPLASASVVTGTLTSGSTDSSTASGTTGTLSGTVTGGAPSGSSSGSGNSTSGGSIGIAPNPSIGSVSGSGALSGAPAQSPGSVLGASTDVPNGPSTVSRTPSGSSLTDGVEQRPIALVGNNTVFTPTANTGLAAAAVTSGVSIGWLSWLLWLLFLVLLFTAAYYYTGRRNNRRSSL